MCQPKPEVNGNGTIATPRLAIGVSMNFYFESASLCVWANDHRQGGWLEPRILNRSKVLTVEHFPLLAAGDIQFSAIGGKMQKHVNALIVANETGREAPGFKTTNKHTKGFAIHIRDIFLSTRNLSH